MKVRNLRLAPSPRGDVMISNAIIVILSLVGILSAQTTSTQMLGTIIDPTGAAVPNATVQVRRVETGETRGFHTDGSGNYIIPSLEIGEYEVTVEATGFQREIRRGVVLELNQKARIDFQLHVGSVTDTVEVVASTPVLKTDDATVGDVVERRRITELPLNGRNFAQLAVLGSPGVRLVPFSIMNGERLAASGQRENQNQFTMDGIVIQNNLINSVSVRPSVEAMEEFKVQTGNFSAEFGNFSGAQVNIALRSGTNDLHGTLFEFLRNDKVDARTFFERPSDPKAPFRRNQFGAVLSGPVYIPGLYRGKDRTFFMFNAELLRHRLAGSTPATVLPLDFRKGDFSSLLAVGKTIHDPRTGKMFPGNIIPGDQLSQQALALLKYMPVPNQNGILNYQAQTRNSIDNNQYLGRIDHVFNERDRIFGHFVHQTNTLVNVGVNPNDEGYDATTDYNVALNHTHLFSSTIINEFRVGWTRFKWFYGNQFTNTDFSILKEFGMVGYPDDPFLAGLPSIGISGYLGLSSTGPGPKVDDTGQIADNISMIRGRHALKAGVDIRLTQEVEKAANLMRGSISFTGDMTGNPVADFMLGIPRSVTGAEALIRAQARNWKYGAYFMDDWHVTPRLTLNLGVRYQLATVVKDPRGALRSLDPSDQTKLYPALGVSAGLYDGDHNNIAPRVGFAWRPFDTKTVFRGGYGIYYNSNQLNNFTILVRNPPLFLTPTLVNDINNPTVTLANPFAVQGTLPTGPYNVISLDPCRCLPQDYNQMWTLNIQRQVSENFGVEVGYMGSLAVHLNRSDDPNQAFPGPGPVQPRRQIPTWAAIRMIRNDSTSTYHALQAQAKRRFSKGLLFVANYSWSHTITDGLDTNAGPFPQNFLRRDLERANSPNDLTHQMTTAFVYDIPFPNTTPLHRVFGGWQTNGILTLESGLPFTVAALGDRANTGSTQRADRLGDGRLQRGQQTPERWFDTSAFTNPALYTYGTSARFILRKAGTKVLDFGLSRNIRFAERNNIQLRGEFFSFFNTPQFGFPSATVGTVNFGRVTSASGNRVIQFALKYSF
ncbi:MAG: TonB-dependent receptor [Bryobacterales bacterium]|nr:TonB-dependent receptor [Bryobacterales bacterium]